MKKFLRFLIIIILTGCTTTSSKSDEKITYTVFSGFHRITNDSNSTLEVFQPYQAYERSENLWLRVQWCINRNCLGYPENFFDVGRIIMPYQTWDDDFRIPNEELFFIRRYRVVDQPEKTFVVYSHAIVPSPDDLLSIELSQQSPFFLTIQNKTQFLYTFCWNRQNHFEEVAWAQDSRLEMKTPYKTWQVFSTSLFLCDNENSIITIYPQQSMEIDATQAYPNYETLPSGTYRWVLTLYPGYTPIYDTTIFSDEFVLTDHR